MPRSRPEPERVNPKTTSANGIELIKRWEGWRSKAYLCPAGIWTIGYGHTKTARRGMRITMAQGERLLKQDLQTIALMNVGFATKEQLHGCNEFTASVLTAIASAMTVVKVGRRRRPVKKMPVAIVALVGCFLLGAFLMWSILSRMIGIAWSGAIVVLLLLLILFW